MASRTDAIVERRLRPIYDAIDAGSYKKALQEVDRVLKKQKDCTCARVLKSLALIRMNRLAEGREILGAVHEESPTDDPTLQAMVICYREIHRVDLIADAYERAVAKDPRNEELLTALFMSYVRLNEYKKQQDVGLNLYKLNSKNPYFFWSVMSLYLQASSEPEEMKRQLLLTLAEKRVAKFVDENKIEAEAEVDLYIMILEKREMFQKILEVCSGPLSRHQSNFLDFLTRKIAFIHYKLGDLAASFETFKNLLKLHPDQMEYYEKLFDLAIKLDMDTNSEGTPRMDEVMALIEELTDTNLTLRGPFLARIYLFYLLKFEESENGRHEYQKYRSSVTGPLLLTGYHSLFGHKTAAIFDILYILKEFKAAKNDLVEVNLNLKQTIEEEPLPDTMDKMSRQLMSHFLVFLCQEQKVSIADKVTMAKNLIRKYLHSLPLVVQVSETDVHPADGFMSLAAHVLLDDQNFDDSILTLAIVSLVKSLESSPSNHCIKLLLMSLYSQIGACLSNQAIFDSLDIKYIQFDTLGFMASGLVSSCAHYSTASNIFNNSLKFYTNNHKDTSDYMISCYKFGSFTKIEEVVELRYKLENSIQFISTSMDRMILDLFHGAKNVQSIVELVRSFEMDPIKDRTNWHLICDNRDFESFGTITLAIERELESKKVTTFNDDKLWLQIRSLIVRSIAAVFYNFEYKILNQQIENVTTNGDGPSPMSALKQLLSELRSIQKEPQLKKSTVSTIWGPPNSRLHVLSDERHLNVILFWLDMISNVSNLEAKDLQIGSLIDDVIKMASESIKSHSLTDNLKLLQTMSQTIETFCFCSVIIALMANFKSSSKIKKKGKKMKDLSLNETCDLWEVSIREMSNSGNRLQEFLNGSLSKKSCLRRNLDDKLVADFDIWERKDMERIIGKVEESLDASYNMSLKELHDLLTLHLKIVSSIKTVDK